MATITRFPEFFKIILDDLSFKTFAFATASITLDSPTVLTFTDTDGSPITLDISDITVPSGYTAANLQLYIQGWINEFRDRVEDYTGVEIYRDTLPQIPVENRLQSIGGELYWAGEPVCVGGDCTGGGTVIPDGTLDRNILVWDADAGIAGEWVEFLDESARMGPYNFFINQKTDIQDRNLKGFWNNDLTDTETENAFLGIYTKNEVGYPLLGFKLGTSFHETTGGTFIKGASLGYDSEASLTGNVENVWVSYYNSSSSDPKSVTGQSILLHTSDSGAGTDTQLFVTDQVDNPQILGRIGSIASFAAEEAQIRLSIDRSVNYRQFQVYLSYTQDAGFQQLYQPGSTNEFQVKHSTGSVEFLSCGSDTGASTPTGGNPGCAFISSSDASVNSGITGSVMVCNENTRTIQRNNTFYSVGGTVLGTVEASNTYDSLASISAYEKFQVFLINSDPGSINFSLPALSDVEFGRTFTIKNVDAVQTVFLTPDGSETIDGVNAVVPIGPLGCRTVIKGTTGWHIIGSF